MRSALPVHSAADTLEHAILVADVFRLIRLALQAPCEVRRRREQQINGHRSHKDDPLFGLRRVLRVAQQRLEEDKLVRIFERLAAEDTEYVVSAAWIAVDL